MGLVADYGFAGVTPSQTVFGTHNVGLTLQVPIFDGGLSEARMDALKSQLEQVKIQRADQQIQVEQDVRSSFLKLDLARQQIVTARASLVLAQKEMTMATDRFAAGLGTSLELVDAQAKLARARDAEVQALVAYQLAQVETTAYKLSLEIKKTQKSANALDKIQIPRLKAEIKYIQDTIEEKEREEFFRLKKVKNRR